MVYIGHIVDCTSCQRSFGKLPWRSGDVERTGRKNLKPELPDFKLIWYLLTLGLKLKQKLRSVFIEGKVIIDLLL